MKTRSLHFVELLISRVLFWGALISITIATTGLLLYVFNGGIGPNLRDQLHHQVEGRPVDFVSIPQIVESLKSGGSPLAIASVGLVLLLMVPILSVTLLIPAFIKEHDYRYSIISTFILLILLIGLVFGGA